MALKLQICISEIGRWTPKVPGGISKTGNRTQKLQMCISEIGRWTLKVSGGISKTGNKKSHDKRRDFMKSRLK